MHKYMKKFFGHLKNVLIHKYWVFHYCCKFGIPVRGLLHDMSKFNPIEFFESVKFYQGDKSPIPEIKKANTVSYAWQHHKGRNPHHYEYWTDHYDDGSRVCHKIPYKYLMELLALRVKPGPNADSFIVYGRGVLHLSVLIETMRREGFELQVGQPKVLDKMIGGQRCEPIENLTIYSSAWLRR